MYKFFTLSHTTPMEQNYHIIRNGTKFIGITLVVYLFMKWMLPMVLPFFVAYFLASIIKNPKGKKKQKTWLKAVTLVAVLVLVGVLIWFMWKEFLDIWARREALLPWPELTKYINQWFDGSTLLEGIKNTLGGMKNTLGGFVAVAACVVATVLMVKDYDKLQQFIEKNTVGHVIVALAKDLSVVGGDYVKAQGQIMLAITAISVVALYVVKNPFALIAGVCIGICDVFPFIGAAAIYIPWAVVMFAQKKFALGCYYVVLAGITSMLRQFLEPKLIGKRVGANPLLVLISIYLGLQIYGIWGVILGPASAFLIWEIYRFT